jgi:hypothetical protein
MNEKPVALASSYRDPAGYVFRQDGKIYRLITQEGKAAFDGLMNSGLYAALIQKNILLPHTEMPADFNGPAGYKIILPEQLPFTSYAWEWSFHQLKDAALLTLEAGRIALEHGMMLKDATPYNVQWHNGALTFIDTLSFEPYSEGKPWIAYRQFCESFLSPLLLMHYRKQSLHALQLAWPDGIPLQTTRALLPWKSRLSMLTWMHIHLHAKYAAKPASAIESKTQVSLAKTKQLLSSLDMLIRSLSIPDTGTTWGDYYTEAATRNDYLVQKEKIIQDWTNAMNGITQAVDFGANNGSFSTPLAEKGIFTIAADGDPVAINKLYKKIRGGNIRNMIPLVVDFTNPSPAMGLGNEERTSFLSRIGDQNLGLCLAFIHHLCIGKNIPLQRVAEILARSCKQLIIEFVPKEDEKATLLLARKKDIYPDYHAAGFEQAFSSCFSIDKKTVIPGSCRTLYQMQRK